MSNSRTKLCPKCNGTAHCSGEGIGHTYHTYHTAKHLHPALGLIGLLGVGKALYDGSKYTCGRCGHTFFRAF